MASTRTWPPKPARTRAAINAIRNAAKARQPKDRAGFIREAQSEMRAISAAKHPQLVNTLQARMLALQGRGGDTEVAHLTPGEVVLPRSLQTPELMKQIATLAARQGIDPARLAVGNRANSINPRTGAREFDDALETVVVTAIDRPQAIDRFDPQGWQWGGYEKYEQTPNRNSADGGPDWGGLGNPEDNPPIVDDPDAPETRGLIEGKNLEELTKMREDVQRAAIKAAATNVAVSAGGGVIVRFLPALRLSVVAMTTAATAVTVSLGALLYAISVRTQELIDQPPGPI